MPMSLRMVSCALLCCFAAGCVEYHPYDTRIKGEKSINSVNALRIEQACAGRRSIRALNFDPDAAVRAMTIYYEFSANDLNIVAKFGNRSLRVSDIVFFSAGVKLQIFKP